ncbi:MAG: restriction endonuclease subunit S [Sulfuritalea sp.]|nr:restriction endonuclease subunit S [Sulfuritalea sp.]
MSSKAGKRLVPKLRFPEFLEKVEWAQKFGDDVFDQINNKQHDSTLPVLAITQEYGAIPRNDIDYQVFVTDKSIESYKVVEVGDFIISLRSFQGGIEYSNCRGICSPAYVILRKKAGVSEAFFKQFFKSERFIRQLNKNIEGLRDGKMVSFKQFSELRLPVPLKDEQEQVADCLSSIDDLISAQAQKVEALKAHKKGLMQQLFPAEGETVPRLRFPEFRSAVAWKETILGSLIEEFRQSSTIQDEFEVLTSARGGLVRQRDYYDNDSITERDNIGFNVIPPDYVTYRSRSDNRRFFFNENNLSITGIISSYYPVFRVVNGCNKFLIELLSFHSNTVGKYSVGTSQTVLSLNELRRIKLPLPTRAEQQQIAHCISSVDEIVATHGQKLEALKAHKRGLMQRLFPSVSESEA